jgi:hypothetical protein
MTVDSEVLRGVVRELLVELLDAPGSGLRAGLQTVAAAGRSPAGGQGAIPVRLADDQDVQNFVQQVLRLAEDPVRREALRAGQIRFALVRDLGAGAQAKASEAGTVRIDRGALTEKAVTAAARSGRSIVLAKGAVVTPLALEKARTLGVAVHKEAT